MYLVLRKLDILVAYILVVHFIRGRLLVGVTLFVSPTS